MAQGATGKCAEGEREAVEGKPTRKGMNMSEAKHTEGELNVNSWTGYPLIVDAEGRGVAKTDCSMSLPSHLQITDINEAKANAARLCAGWNLLNRLEAAGIKLDELESRLDEVAELLSMTAEERRTQDAGEATFNDTGE